jgi:hypothetical protein
MEYSHLVEKQRMMIEAEEWSKKPKSLHSFNTKTCKVWYETRPDDGNVTDVEFYSGLIERTISGTKEVVYLGKKLEGEELLHRYSRRNA